MESSKISDSYLLFQYSNILKQIDALYMEKKALEKEIAARNELLKLKVQRGEIQIERGEEIE